MLNVLVFLPCCGCINYTSLYKTLYNDTKHYLATVSQNHGLSPERIVFPVLGDASQASYYGFSFVPLYYLDEGMLITLKKTPQEVSQELFQKIFDLWPLLVVFLFMASISGFVIWAIVRKNLTIRLCNTYYGHSMIIRLF